MLDSPFIKEGYRLNYITLPSIGAEQRMKPRGIASNIIKLKGVLVWLYAVISETSGSI